MKANLITKHGYKELEDELTYLWKVHRPEITEKVAWAASLGDRSDNADYKENKRLLRQIDSRIRYISKRLDAVQIVSYSQEQEGRVFFGAWVEIQKCSEPFEKKTFRVVGPDEIYSKKNVISIDSPMARALLKHGEGDTVSVPTPKSDNDWKILNVWYEK